ncbi:hypothetical protein M407DRAFT_28300 [Tulasnella calospora MUT 4182]|uniref:Uncharacterized protein n=1 Tax=Tulasnella calospora MUT 4182 TaxID=1051891 RepID=A0A0C3KL48_9AGAM|nr:hypothetical protein M407DRAFT_28300 [Tulasnella calospora MUT 4182]
METPPSGMPSPPLSPQGTPSSLSSDFPSLEGSIYSVLAPDSPCSEPRDFHYYRYTNNVAAGGGFSSHDVHHEAMQHLILPSLTLQQQREAASRALSRTASVAGFGDYGNRQQQLAAPPAPVGEPSRSSILHHNAIELPENVRLLVIGRRGAGKTFLCENLVQGSVEGFAWTHEPALGKVLSQTTPIDEKRRNGLRIVRLDGWDESDEPSQVLDSILATIQQPFRELDQVLHPTALNSTTASVNLSIDLLTSTAAPLYTAAIVVLSPNPTAIETSLLRTLSQHIPVIPFSPHQQRRRRHHSPDYFNDSRAQSRHRPSSRISSHHHHHHQNQYSGIHSRAPSIPRLTPISDSPRQQQLAPLLNFAFHPTSHRALKEWLFDETNLKGLRKDAAKKFLDWRVRERSVEAYLPPQPSIRDDCTPPHNNTMYSAQFLDPHHQPAPAMLPLDAFERFTFDQMFSPSDFESADLDSEVEAEVARESEAESRSRGRRTAAAPPPSAAAAATDDEGDAADVERSDAEEGLVLVRGQYLHAAQSDAESEKENGGNDRTWEADLSRMVALRKREREHFSRMETIRPSSFHHFQSHSSLRRPLSEVVPTHTEADNLLLFHPNQHQLPPPQHLQRHHQNDTPDYECLEHGEAGYQTASSDLGPLSSPSSFPPSTTSAPSNPSREASTPPSDPALDFASLDPLHFPSLLSLALSILPEIKTRIVAKIKFWILPAAFTLPRHLDDLNEKLGAAAQTRSGETATAVWDEKRGLVVESDVDDVSSGGDGKSTAIMLSLPAVGAIAAAAAALGFWAGLTVEGRAGLLTLRSM